MSVREFYNTIQVPAIADHSVQGSKFIAYAFPLEDLNEFKFRLSSVKKEHPKASHHCFAFRVGPEGDQFRVSDDREPSGSAGRPILGQIDSRKLTNTLVIVVRYFGGTLLGIPGLIKAYKTAAAEVLDRIPVIQLPVLARYKLHFGYLQLNEVMVILKQFNCKTLSLDQQLSCRMEIAVQINHLEQVLQRFKEVAGLEYEPATPTISN